MMRIDARIEVVFGTLGDARPGDALLLEAGAPVPSGWPVQRLGAAGAHAAGCGCCAARSPAAEALGHLFLRRARGEVTLFCRLVAVGGHDLARAVQDALASDSVASARYRLAV